MILNKFISIVLVLWGGYYLIVIFFDLLKSNNKVAAVTNHSVQFEAENPIMITDETVRKNHSTKVEINEEEKKYPSADEPKSDEIKNFPLIDLGLETLSGEPYIVSAENLSKFIIS